LVPESKDERKETEQRSSPIFHWESLILKKKKKKKKARKRKKVRKKKLKKERARKKKGRKKKNKESLGLSDQLSECKSKLVYMTHPSCETQSFIFMCNSTH